MLGVPAQGRALASGGRSGLSHHCGEDDLALYQFKTAKHYFCRHCGIHPFVRPRLDPGRWAFNVPCIDGIDLASLKTYPFDGQNWEATARAYYDHLKKP